MSDAPEWEKKYWEQRAQQAQTKPTAPLIPQRPHNSEVDASQVMMQRMLGQQMQPDSSGGNLVYLREGVNYYRQIPNPDGFGTTMPLIHSMGPLTQITGKQFEMKGEVRGYCIDNLPHVDLSKVNKQPERMLVLVKVKAPFVGDILVPRDAIIEGTRGGQQLLRG